MKGERLLRIAEAAEAVDAAEARHATYPWTAERAAQILADCEAAETWLNRGNSA